MAETLTHPPQPRRRWFQFRLRTMLVGVSLLCAALAWHMNRVQQQRRAVELIEAAGGRVFYEFERSHLILDAYDVSRWTPEPLVELFGQDFFYNVRAVSFSQQFPSLREVPTPERLRAFEVLSTLPALSDLVVDNLVVGRDELVVIGRLNQLERLYLNCSLAIEAEGGFDIADLDLAPLHQMTHLRWLDMHGARVNDTGLTHLRELVQLERLVVSGTKVTAAGVADLQKALPHTTIEH